MRSPRVSYIIASTMRTGSYLLCEALEATGRAGHPREIFCPERRGMYESEWQLPKGVALDDFLRTALEQGTTANGVFGTKIHFHHVAPMAREAQFSGDAVQVLRQFFPGAKYIHLRRRDRRGQAISWYRAKISNEWWRIRGVTQPDLTRKVAEFHAPEIRRREFELERQQQAWDRFFADPAVESIMMDYETLAANYREEVARVLAFIGEDPALAQALPEPRLQVQADATTEEWRAKMDALFPEG
jgi:trehalose 2-sulfotransferase